MATFDELLTNGQYKLFAEVLAWNVNPDAKFELVGDSLAVNGRKVRNVEATLKRTIKKDMMGAQEPFGFAYEIAGRDLNVTQVKVCEAALMICMTRMSLAMPDQYYPMIMYHLMNAWNTKFEGKSQQMLKARREMLQKCLEKVV